MNATFFNFGFNFYNQQNNQNPLLAGIVENFQTENLENGSFRSVVGARHYLKTIKLMKVKYRELTE